MQNSRVRTPQFLVALAALILAAFPVAALETFPIYVIGDVSVEEAAAYVVAANAELVETKRLVLAGVMPLPPEAWRPPAPLNDLAQELDLCSGEVGESLRGMGLLVYLEEVPKPSRDVPSEASQAANASVPPFVGRESFCGVIRYNDSALVGVEIASLFAAVVTPGGNRPATRAPFTPEQLEHIASVSMPGTIPGGSPLILHGGRFWATVEWAVAGAPPTFGFGQPEVLSDRSGTFWFFNPNNVEMLLKVLNACVEPFNRYWVFYAATTNVTFVVTVVDQEASGSDRRREYIHQGGPPAPPVADTAAFATCP